VLQGQIELPAGDQEPVEQGRHVDVPVAAKTVEYFPCSHGLHADDPVDVVYVPGAHAVHVPPAGPEYPALQMQLVEIELPEGE